MDDTTTTDTTTVSVSCPEWQPEPWDDRNLVVLAVHRPVLYPGLALPVVSLTCWCGGTIAAADVDADTVGVSRVNGDSEYGYEAYHQACL